MVKAEQTVANLLRKNIVKDSRRKIYRKRGSMITKVCKFGCVSA